MTVGANPKTLFLSKGITGSSLVITSEDKDYWTDAAKPLDAIAEPGMVDTLVLGEVLQRVDDPLAYLKLAKVKSKRIVLTVPNEFSWKPEYAPFTNKSHKNNFDAQALGDLLEASNLSYVMKAIDYGGWAFLGAECSA